MFYTQLSQRSVQGGAGKRWLNGPYHMWSKSTLTQGQLPVLPARAVSR